MSDNGDYLRVCGADLKIVQTAPPFRGLSPRVRSGHRVARVVPGGMRIISACAERTWSTCPVSVSNWDYLRVCGADNATKTLVMLLAGLSPRVRSGRHAADAGLVSGGIISACAEQTVVFYCGLSRSGDMDYLIRALRGVGKRRGYQYLE